MATIRKKIYDTRSDEPFKGVNPEDKPETTTETTQPTPDDPPAKPKPVEPDRAVGDIKTFDQLYGAYNSKPAIKDYTPEEKAALEKQAKRARWADAAVVLGRALQGKDMQLDKTQTSQIREKIDARNKAYMDAVERNNANKAAWELTRNQERIRWYQKELERADLSDARKQEYELKVQDLQLQTDRLKLQRDQHNLDVDELKARKEGTYYDNKDGKKSGTPKPATVVAQTSFERYFPDSYTGLSNYVASAMSQGKYKAGEEKGYVANWMNRFKDADGNFNIPAPVITEINNKLSAITKINAAIEKHKRGEDISSEFPDPTKLRKMVKDEIKSLTDYIMNVQPSSTTTSGNAPATSTKSPEVKSKDDAVKNKWGV